MAYPEVLIPPSVKPESPVEFEQIDDQTVVFQPAFARGLSQRQTWGDPLWGLRLRYKGLSQEDRALLKAAVSDARGMAANVRVTPGLPLRGSFPADELFTNHDFRNGTTGWTAENVTLSVADRIMRVAPATVATHDVLQSVALTQYAPHVLRSFLSDGEQSSGLNIGPSISASAATSIGTSRGLVTVANVALSAASQAHYPALATSTSGYTVGMNFNVHWTSLARCFQVDGGGNLLTYSDQIDNAAWTKSEISVTANEDVAPDGTTTGDKLTPSTNNSVHYIRQNHTVASAAADIVLCGAFKGSGYNYVMLSMIEGAASTQCYYMFNLLTGAVGATASTGAQWSNLRAFIVPLGNDWHYCCIVARKANAATTISAYAYAYAADSAASFAGNGTSGIRAWRVTSAQSSVPVRLTQTTTTATTGTTQTGSGIYVKGLPASTDGLLEIGDFIEIHGELKRVTARLNSDAAGRGYLQFRPGLAVAAANDEPVIVNNPMGRFMIVSVRETERYGLYTDVELDLIEAPA